MTSITPTLPIPIHYHLISHITIPSYSPILYFFIPHTLFLPYLFYPPLLSQLSTATRTNTIELLHSKNSKLAGIQISDHIMCWCSDRTFSSVLNFSYSVIHVSYLVINVFIWSHHVSYSVFHVSYSLLLSLIGVAFTWFNNTHDSLVLEYTY